MVWTRDQAEVCFGDARNRGTLSGTQALLAHPLSARVEECKTAAAAVVTFTLPDARELVVGGSQMGATMLFLSDATSAETFDVLDNAGGTIATVDAGEWCTVYLLSKSTQAGTWRYRIGTAGSGRTVL